MTTRRTAAAPPAGAAAPASAMRPKTSAAAAVFLALLISPPLPAMSWSTSAVFARTPPTATAPSFPSSASTIAPTAAGRTDCDGDRRRRRRRRTSRSRRRSSSSSSTSLWAGGDDDENATHATTAAPTAGDLQLERNAKYVMGLLENLEAALDKWIINGSLATRRRAYNIIRQIERECLDPELSKRATRMAKRAGMPLDEPPPPPPTEHVPATEQRPQLQSPQRTTSSSTGSAIDAQDEAHVQVRKEFADARRKWEESRGADSTTATGKGVKERVSAGRSALSSRAASNAKPDLFMPQIGKSRGPSDVKSFADGKKELQDELGRGSEGGEGGSAESSIAAAPDEAEVETAASRSSELVARAGAGSAFEGETLGIGGLDEVLAQVKRRVWVPLAAPPSLLRELGIQPVRGLLLYGEPGCGKTLLARTLGKILSPMRPITVVSGPEIMDKFVGSSEANLREIFDNPPDVYDTYRIANPDVDGDALSNSALHVIVLDEFDAVARSRGGAGKGDQGDAGVARDSVVNQLLAKMDGVDALGVPTLVVGLTNRRTLIEPALLRPGRFEVQIEVPPPRTVAQRVSILTVHTKDMFRAGRVLVRDAPDGTAAAHRLERTGKEGVASYEELLDLLAVECDGMSGASLAGVARAAASRALERAVCDFAGSIADSGGGAVEGGSIADCLVTQEDFEKAVEDVFESSRGGDGVGSSSARDADSGEEDDGSTEEGKDAEDSETSPDISSSKE